MISLKKLIVEGRYDGLVTKLSKTLLQVIKDSFAAKDDPEGFFGRKDLFQTRRRGT
jgi:hypothetical protein